MDKRNKDKIVSMCLKPGHIKNSSYSMWCNNPFSYKMRTNSAISDCWLNINACLGLLFIIGGQLKVVTPTLQCVAASSCVDAVNPSNLLNVNQIGSKNIHYHNHLSTLGTILQIRFLWNILIIQFLLNPLNRPSSRLISYEMQLHIRQIPHKSGINDSHLIFLHGNWNRPSGGVSFSRWCRSVLQWR